MRHKNLYLIVQILSTLHPRGLIVLKPIIYIYLALEIFFFIIRDITPHHLINDVFSINIKNYYSTKKKLKLILYQET